MLDELENILWGLTVDRLHAHAKKMKVSKTGSKYDIIERLKKLYGEDNWIRKNYDLMDEVEKEYMNTIIRQKFNPIKESILELDNKYQIEPNHIFERISYYFIEDFIPECFKNELVKFTTPLEIKFQEIEDTELENYYGYIIGADKNLIYIDEFLKFVNTNSVKLTEKSKLISKDKFLKFISTTNLKEIIRNTSHLPNDIKNFSESTIVYGISKMLETAFIINNDNGYYKPSVFFDTYIKKNNVQKSRFLLEAYLESKYFHINETKRVMNGKFSLYDYPNLKIPREFILEMIKKLPIDSYVSGDEFIKFIRMKDYRFLRDQIGNILRLYDSWYGSSFYEECSFFEFENNFIDICLMEYFAIIGIIDVIIDKNYTKDGYEFLSVKYLKLTKFGAMVLGLIDEVISDISKKIIITDDLKIIVDNNSESLEYQIYFDRFLDSIKKDNQLIYDLNFKGIAKALDIGLSLDDIYCFLRLNCQDMPTKLYEEFMHYNEIIGKIKVKTITVLEYDKEYEDLILSKLKNVKEDLNCILPIRENKINYIKEKLEDNKLFCQIEKE